MKNYELNRKTYKNIKKMDHSEMNAFCVRLYAHGFEDGKKAASGLSESEIREVILKVKGIGEKKADDIISAIVAANKENGGLTDG